MFGHSLFSHTTTIAIISQDKAAYETKFIRVRLAVTTSTKMQMLLINKTMSTQAMKRFKGMRWKEMNKCSHDFHETLCFLYWRWRHLKQCHGMQSVLNHENNEEGRFLLYLGASYQFVNYQWCEYFHWPFITIDLTRHGKPTRYFCSASRGHVNNRNYDRYLVFWNNPHFVHFFHDIHSSFADSWLYVIIFNHMMLWMEKSQEVQATYPP